MHKKRSVAGLRRTIWDSLQATSPSVIDTLTALITRTLTLQERSIVFGQECLIYLRSVGC